MVLKRTFIRWRRPLILLLHMSLAVLIYFAAFWIRFDLNLSHGFYPVFWQTLPIAVLIKTLALGYFKLHRGLWRYVSVNDLWRLIQACVASAALLTVFIAFYPGFRGFPRSVIPIDLGLSILVFGGKRLSVRMLREFWDGKRNAHGERRRVLIAGAGAAGIMAMKELMRNPRDPCSLVGFLDDDPYKRSMLLDGHRVWGTLDEAANWVKELDADEILLAMPSAPKHVGRNLVNRCKGLPVKFKSLPALGDLLSGRLDVSAIREIQLEDLLGRDPVALDRSAIRTVIQDAGVLVTGAGGSIGSEICRQVAELRPSNLFLLDVAETPLFEVENELRAKFPEITVSPILTDVQNTKDISQIMALCRPRYVFHAAAYKHVPMLESHPVEGILNNVLGTRNVAQAAAECGVDRFVLISTDKAVRPANVMGATKRCAELLIQSMTGGATTFLAVRFGNVLGSNGSVVPIFRRQIEAGGPVTLTHKDVTRYFMTIPEAVELVLQSMRLGHSGDIHILEMGQPIRIYDLARQLIELSGRTLGVDVGIVETGLRPGEKLHEELALHDQDLQPSVVPNVRTLVLRKLPAAKIQSDIESLIDLSRDRRIKETVDALWGIIRNYDGNLAS